MANPSQRTEQLLFELHKSGAQIGHTQAVPIASVISLYDRACNLLVYGCGNDSIIWQRINENGKTLFVEDKEVWAERCREQAPELDILTEKYAGISVADSAEATEEYLAGFECPVEIREGRWDVVVIDGPAGNKPWAPGRALPIYWTSKYAAPGCHVFVDDYNRSLENSYSQMYLFKNYPHRCELVRRGSAMLWCIPAPHDGPGGKRT